MLYQFFLRFLISYSARNYWQRFCLAAGVSGGAVSPPTGARGRAPENFEILVPLEGGCNRFPIFRYSLFFIPICRYSLFFIPIFRYLQTVRYPIFHKFHTDIPIFTIFYSDNPIFTHFLMPDI